MPNLPSPTAVIIAAAAAASSTPPAPSATVTSICAFPVSGQYGPGSRILYYVLVAGCVLGRGSTFLRGACLAAALLIPAVAALHGIVLASVHVDGAVDMDVYGAFQICAIGVLAAPVTVRLSATYFNTPGRNLIFIWTGICLAGLIALVVEFFRVETFPCPQIGFTQGLNDTLCNVVCDETKGPFSSIRTGAQNNIYVISNPTILTFGAATLLCAACCIPPILSLVMMWTKILQINWKSRYGRREDDMNADVPISGTNAATPSSMNRVNENIRFYLKMIEIPIFGAAIMAILIVGERNFWSESVNYMTEPIASVGQWAPIVGTVLAAAGSLYALLAAGKFDKSETGSSIGGHHCTCSQHHLPTSSSSEHDEQPEMEERHTPETMDVYPGEESMLSPQNTYQSSRHSVASPLPSPQSNLSRHVRHSSTGNSRSGPQSPSHDLNRSMTAGTLHKLESNSRHKVARIFEKIGDKIGTPAPNAFDDSTFQRGLASDFPELPGERERNPELQKIKDAYNPKRDSEGFAAPNPLRRTNSRANSFISVSSAGMEDDHSEPPSPASPAAGPSGTGPTLAQRRATLEVPTKHGSIPILKPRSMTLSSASRPNLGLSATPASPISPTIRISEPTETVATRHDPDAIEIMQTPSEE